MDSHSDEPTLRIRGLRKSHRRRGEADRVAVDGLDLELDGGEILGLLGPNGAGKSTLTSLVCGLSVPDAGEIRIFGRRSGAREASVRAQIGLAPQELAIYPQLSARENLEFCASMYRLDDASDRIDEALAFVGLHERARDRTSTFSGGMKRRLNLAIAVLHAPRLLLLDEPTVGVDPQSRNLILDRVRQLRDRGHAILYTSHHMDEVARVSDRVAIMDRGRVLDCAAIGELLRRHAGRRRLSVTLDEQPLVIETDDPIEELQRLRSKGKISDFCAHTASLEEVFLTLTGRELRDA